MLDEYYDVLLVYLNALVGRGFIKPDKLEEMLEAPVPPKFENGARNVALAGRTRSSNLNFCKTQSRPSARWVSQFTGRRVFEGVNPQGVRVAHFGVPTPEELNHDFLWRVHKEVPGNGEIVIFNRSHYEGVLVVRVHKLVPGEVWKNRYQEIVDFERSLFDEGTTIIKFYLHIDADEQKKRLQDRLNDPTKRWKFSYNDQPEREHWSEYMRAYEDVLEKTSTKWAPWVHNTS